MKKTVFLFALLLASIIFVTTESYSQTSPVPPIPLLALGDAVPGEYIVKLKSRALGFLSTENVGRLLGGVVKQRFDGDPDLLVLKNDGKFETEFTQLYQNELVEYVEPNYIYQMDKTPNDPDYSKTWGMKNSRADIDINMEKAWDISTGSSKVVVAVIDTGVDLTHPELKDNLWTNEAELNGKPGVDDDGNGFIDDIYGYDFNGNKGSPQDDNGHGTHVAGVIGAKGDNGIGVAGVNWNVKIMALKFLDAEGRGTVADAVRAIDYAIAMGAKISNNSWGGRKSSQALKDAVQRAANAGLLFVAAAGNYGEDDDTIGHYPGSYQLPNVVSVAAIGPDGSLAEFSNYGIHSVQVAAPGVDIYSTYKDGGYATLNGTSMATPHVTGVAALALSVKNMNMNDLRNKVISSVRPLPSLTGKIKSGGYIDAYKAVSP